MVGNNADLQEQKNVYIEVKIKVVYGVDKYVS